MNTIKLDSKNVRMIAHRGLSGLEKENTLPAFVAAGNREKYYGIETDVHVTGDGHYVVFHDDRTARVGIDDLCIEKSSFETLRKLRLTDLDGKRGRADLVIPTLEEYICVVKKYEKVCVCELKNPMPVEHIRAIADIFAANDYLAHTVFISFSRENLIHLREYLPEQPIQYLIEHELPEDLFETLEKYNFELDIDRVLITQELIDRVHTIGHKINVWTVNTLEEGEKLVAMGVDFITTNILE